jgi:hypothetical protein
VRPFPTILHKVAQKIDDAESQVSPKTNVDLFFGVPFDHSVYVEEEVLGTVRDLQIGSNVARIEFPGRALDLSNSLALQPPPSVATNSALSPVEWGLQQQGWTIVDAVLVVVPVQTELTFELRGHQVGGEPVAAIIENIDQLFDRLCHWLYVLTGQSLDPRNPDPKVISRRSKNIIVAAATEHEVSAVSSGNPTLKVRYDPPSSASERVVNLKVLDAAILGAGSATAPPMMHELLSAARIAARRGDSRRAMIDAGTAVEAALSQLLRLPANHSQTLGSLTQQAIRDQLPIPVDIKPSLVLPRNDAVHRGLVTPRPVSLRALEIAEEIVALADPQLIRCSTLRSVNRPDRQDLVLYTQPATE